MPAQASPGRVLLETGVIGLGHWAEVMRVAAMVAVLGTAATAHAEVALRAPIGWERDDDGEAARRVRRWLQGRSDARVLSVYTPGARDGFAETIALVEIDGAFGAGDAGEFAAALAGVPGVDVAEPKREDFADGAPRTGATWEHERLFYRADVVASDSTRTLLVQCALADEAALYGRTFTEVRDSLTGAAALRPSFDRRAWRTRVVLGGGLGIAAVFGVAMWRRPFGASARSIGRVVAGLCVVLAVVAALLTGRALADRSEELRTAGLVPGTLAAEVATWGLTAAVIVWLIGVWLARREAPVASAPLRGSFADRSGASMVSVPIIPIVPKRAESGPVRRHPDGASRLDPVTVPPGGGLQKVDERPRPEG
jgi:hypothetical protein